MLDSELQLTVTGELEDTYLDPNPIERCMVEMISRRVRNQYNYSAKKAKHVEGFAEWRSR